MLSALAGYILLPYLSTLMPVSYTGVVVAGGGLAALLFFPFLPRIIARWGAQQITLVLGLIEMIVLLMLATGPSIAMSVTLIILFVAVQPFIAYGLDILLEAAGTTADMTGRVRALFLTAWSTGSFVAPLLLGVLMNGTNEYALVFIAATGALVPFVLLFAARRLPIGANPEISPMQDSLACILRNRDIAAVTFGHIILWLFYVWAPLYVPIYLHNVLGIPWSSLGWIFAVMLIPYIVIEYPARWLADRFTEEKNLMFAGFIIAGGALATVSLITSESSSLSILGILLVSRLGAALIESMTEGHFFRRVSERDINSVSIFRAAWPLSFVVAPLIGSIILFFGDYQLLFIITGGFIAIGGALSTLFIKDSRIASTTI